MHPSAPGVAWIGRRRSIFARQKTSRTCKQTGYDCALPDDPDDCIPAQLKLNWPWAERCHTPLDLSQPCGLLSP